MDKNQATKKGWLTANLEDLEFRRLYERELVAESFIVCIEDAMEDQELTKTELAKRMQCSSANVSRALRKSTNMTIATVVDMALSLNLRVRISLDPLAADECAFVPKVAPTKAWPQEGQKEEHMTNPSGFVMCFCAQHRTATTATSAVRERWPTKSTPKTESSKVALELIA